MRHKQNALLAGVAAFTLFAATGAFAQQGQLDQKGGAQMNAPSGVQTERSNQGAKGQGSMNQGGMNQGGMNQVGTKRGATEKGATSGQNAQSERRSGQGAAVENGTAKGGMTNGKSSSSSNRSAQEPDKNNKGPGATDRTAQDHQQFNTRAKTTESKNGRFAAQPENRNRRGAGTAQGNESLKGLQGNTSVPMRVAGGANVTLNEQQRTQIRDTIINDRGAPRVGNVDFDVTVGTTIPRGHLHLVRVPETLVRIDAGWRGFLYFVYNDEIVIVDPHDMRIVEVLPV